MWLECQVISHIFIVTHVYVIHEILDCIPHDNEVQVVWTVRWGCRSAAMKSTVPCWLDESMISPAVCADSRVCQSEVTHLWRIYRRVAFQICCIYFRKREAFCTFNSSNNETNNLLNITFSALPNSSILVLLTEKIAVLNGCCRFTRQRSYTVAGNKITSK